MTGEPMTPEDRAHEMHLWGVYPGAVIAAAIETCRMHSRPVETRWGGLPVTTCKVCETPWPCPTYLALSIPLLAAGVPERELRGKEAADG